MSVETGAGLVGLAEIREAASGLLGVAIRTPLLPADVLSTESDAEVRLKCESLQRTGSFKTRGAYTFVRKLPPHARDAGIITYSSGNHAQAVALAARLTGTSAVVVMPVDAPAVKREGTIALGAEVVLEGRTSLERKARAEEIQAERGLAMVPPFDHPDIIAGQGTVGLEVHQDWGEMDTFFVPIGGGGLSSGCAAALRALNPDCRIYGVEPEGAASMKAAVEAGGPVTLDSTETIADGLKPVRAGDLTHAHCAALLDDIITVADSDILEAASVLLKSSKLVVEFSGAASVAALRSKRIPLAGRRVAAVLSGGNLDPSLLERIA